MSDPAALWSATWASRAKIARRPFDPGLFVCLAPMDGVTDHVYRQLLTDQFDGHSGISLCVSEFVRVTNQRVPAHVFLRHCPELDRGGHTRAGVPVFVQLLGGLPEAMAEAARAAAALGAPGIDLNFGCPAKTVNRHDGGATLLKVPTRVEAVTRAVRDAVPTHIPVTVKIRIGWDSAEGIEDLARAAEQGGGAWLTIHARTRKQLYKPPVDWDCLERARRATSIPVVANGDIFDIGDLPACAARNGCSSFMIGRGAMARPELFARVRGIRDSPLSTGEFSALLLDYCSAMRSAGHSPKAALGRLKQWLRMGAPAREDLAGWFEEIKRMQSLESAEARLAGECEPTKNELEWLPRGPSEMRTPPVV